MKKLIIGNWKMNLSLAMAYDFFEKLAKSQPFSVQVEWGIIPPQPLVIPLKHYIRDNDWDALDHLGLQDFYPKMNGAFTGETGFVNFEDINLDYLLIGHSERRMIFNEDAKLIKEKLIFALNNSNTTPIYIFGEAKEERKQDSLENIISEKIEDTLATLSEEDISKIIIAYEPIWSIGTGKVPTNAEIEEVFKIIRGIIAKRFNDKIAKEIKIIYGGSVNETNYKSILSSSEVDGLLVGGASLIPDKFIKMLNYE